LTWLPSPCDGATVSVAGRDPGDYYGASALRDPAMRSSPNEPSHSRSARKADTIC